jgi:hypothetical protein
MSTGELTGGCLCGAVRYRTGTPNVPPTLCHCASCRRATGAHAVGLYTVARATAEFTATKQMLDHTINRMAVVQASCERIRSTPVPFGYTLLLHRTAYLFCFMLSFGFADTLGWATPFAVAVVAYTFFGLDVGAPQYGPRLEPVIERSDAVKETLPPHRQITVRTAIRASRRTAWRCCWGSRESDRRSRRARGRARCGTRRSSRR